MKIGKRTVGTSALALGAALVFLFTSAESCGSNDQGQRSESATQQSNYDQLVQAQPAKAMTYSPTRETINAWIDTWGKPGKLAYVYLQASNGQLVGYYVTKGLPVSYCASLTPNFRVDGGDGTGKVVTPAPSMDGVYYGSGGDCGTFYARDASTNSMIEYTTGTGISALVYEQPLPRQDIQPLGFTTIPPK